ncbi:MAG: hypothetical protein ACTH3B_10305 [Pseudoalteromonas sp.]
MAEIKVTYSIDGFRRNLARELKELKRDIEHELSENNIEFPDDIKERFNNLACMSNSFNCVYVDGLDDFGNLSDIPEIELFN